MASSSLMASSSSLPRTWRYSVFTSFHGPDVRKTFLSHLRKQFNCNGISMFDDQRIKRGQTIAPELIRAIRESRISIVVLSEYYASSSWCLDELVEIFKCKEDKNQIVMTIFYGRVDPSDVRKQTGDFGEVFKNTCNGKTEEERRKWSQALTHAGNIAGEHFLKWDNESEMIEKIARDVSNKLNATVSRDFEDMVGIEAHLGKMKTLLHLDEEDGAMIVGICGPVGIGKTTIARALHSQLSSSFQHSCFMENLRGSCNSGLDEYGLKLRLQELLLSKIFNQNGMRIYHLGMIPERLHDRKVLIILDDVDNLQQLEALANDTNWFGHGSRIIVTTEDQELLEQHGINNTYHVDFPPIENAFFFNYAYDGHVKAMLADSKLDAILGLKTLVYKSLIQISVEGKIVMHKLLQQVGLQANQRQEPRKRQILIDTDDILDALENDSGSRSLMGICFDISTIKDSIEISPRALKRMRNLQFLRIYNTRRDTNVRVHVPEDIDFPPRLKLLHWEEYPGKCLPHTLRPENLVELKLENSTLKHLWKGTQTLGNLRKLILANSDNLEELPDLAKATNLKILDVSDCHSLVEIHSSVGNLHKLETLEMNLCRKLQVVPSLFNLASLQTVSIIRCDQLRKLPDIPAAVTVLSIVDTMLEELVASIRLCSRLVTLSIVGSATPNQLMTEPPHAQEIERFPDCIKDLHSLKTLYIFGCLKLASLPELPKSLTSLLVYNCESLETLVVPFPSDSQIQDLCFVNCFKLGPEARRAITKQLPSSQAILPGRDIPAEEFNHRAIGNSLTISSKGGYAFRVCLIVSPKSEMKTFKLGGLMCRISINGCPTENCGFPPYFELQSEHLATSYSQIFREEEQYSQILFEFSSSGHEVEIIECGVQILVEETISEQLLDNDYGTLSDESFELDASRVEDP